MSDVWIFLLLIVALTYVQVERSGRGKWQRNGFDAEAGPYRTSSITPNQAQKAPFLVRAAALASIILALVGLRALVVTIRDPRLDGVGACVCVAGTVGLLCGWSGVAMLRRDYDEVAHELIRVNAVVTAFLVITVALHRLAMCPWVLGKSIDNALILASTSFTQSALAVAAFGRHRTYAS